MANHDIFSNVTIEQWAKGKYFEGHFEIRDYQLPVNSSNSETTSIISKAEALNVSVIHGSQEKRTPFAQSWDNDGRFEWKVPIDIWDGEAGETVEFIVSVERNGVQWRDSMCTVTMDEFRKSPEKRCILDKKLFSMGSSTEQISRGNLVVTLSYTEDCMQPTFLHSLFCTAFVGYERVLDSFSIDTSNIFPSHFLSARSRAQQRLIEREWSAAPPDV